MGGKEDKGLGDVFKKISSLGLGSAFLSEEALKNIIGDIPLPKNIVNGLLENARVAKEDFAKSLGDEFRRYLSKVDTDKAIDYIAENYDIEMKASFSLKKKEKKASSSDS